MELKVKNLQIYLFAVSWDSLDKVSCRVYSALVEPHISKIASLSVLTSQEHAMSLPIFEQVSDVQTGETSDYIFNDCESIILEPWITEVSLSEFLDKNDPLAVPSTTNYFRPSTNIKNEFNLESDSPFLHRWQDENKINVVEYIGWGETKFKDGTGFKESGNALFCSSNFLSKVLTKLKKELIVLIKLERNYKSNQSNEHIYSYQLSLINASLNIRTIKPTAKQLNAIQNLNHQEAVKFENRFNVLKDLS